MAMVISGSPISGSARWDSAKTKLQIATAEVQSIWLLRCCFSLAITIRLTCTLLGLFCMSSQRACLLSTPRTRKCCLATSPTMRWNILRMCIRTCENSWSECLWKIQIKGSARWRRSNDQSGLPTWTGQPLISETTLLQSSSTSTGLTFTRSSWKRMSANWIGSTNGQGYPNRCLSSSSLRSRHAETFFMESRQAESSSTIQMGGKSRKSAKKIVRRDRRRLQSLEIGWSVKDRSEKQQRKRLIQQL